MGLSGMSRRTVVQARLLGPGEFLGRVGGHDDLRLARQPLQPRPLGGPFQQQENGLGLGRFGHLPGHGQQGLELLGETYRLHWFAAFAAGHAASGRPQAAAGRPADRKSASGKARSEPALYYGFSRSEATATRSWFRDVLMRRRVRTCGGSARPATASAPAGSPFTYCCQRSTLSPRSLPVTFFERQHGPILHGRVGVGEGLAQGGHRLRVFGLAQGLGGRQPHVGVHVAPQRLGKQLHCLSVAVSSPGLAGRHTNMGIGRQPWPP